MKEQSNYFIIGEEKSITIDEKMLKDLNFNGGIKEFFCTIRKKLEILEGVGLNDVVILDFKANAKAYSIPDKFVCKYVVYTFYNKDEIIEKYSKYVDSLGGRAKKFWFNAQSNVITMDIDLPISMKEQLEKPYAINKLQADIKSTMEKFYPVLFVNIKYF